MNRKKIVTTAMTVAFAFGLAFSSTVFAATKEGSETALPYNGITYFDMGKTPRCVTTASASDGGETRKSFNGITQFDLGIAGSYGNGSCTQESHIQSARLFNGITLF